MGWEMSAGGGHGERQSEGSDHEGPKASRGSSSGVAGGGESEPASSGAAAEMRTSSRFTQTKPSALTVRPASIGALRFIRTSTPPETAAAWMVVT